MVSKIESPEIIFFNSEKSNDCCEALSMDRKNGSRKDCEKRGGSRLISFAFGSKMQDRISQAAAEDFRQEEVPDGFYDDKAGL